MKLLMLISAILALLVLCMSPDLCYDGGHYLQNIFF